MIIAGDTDEGDGPALVKFKIQNTPFCNPNSFYSPLFRPATILVANFIEQILLATLDPSLDFQV